MDTPDGPSQGQDGAPPFALDPEARLADLRAAGFDEIEAWIWPWTAVYGTARVVALYSTFSTIRALEPAQVTLTFLEDN